MEGLAAAWCSASLLVDTSVAVPCVGDLGLTSRPWEGGVRFIPGWGGEGGNFLISSSRFAAGPELGVCSVGGGRELVLESGSPVTVTYFPAGVNSLLAGPVPPLHGNCREQPALRHLSARRLGQPVIVSAVRPRALRCRWPRAQGRGSAGHEGLWQSSDLEQCQEPGNVQGCGVGGCLSLQSRRRCLLGPAWFRWPEGIFGVPGVTRKGFHSGAVWCAVVLRWMLSLCRIQCERVSLLRVRGRVSPPCSRWGVSGSLLSPARLAVTVLLTRCSVGCDAGLRGLHPTAGPPSLRPQPLRLPQPHQYSCCMARPAAAGLQSPGAPAWS